MRRIVNYAPSAGGRLLLGALPFAIAVIAYVIVSDARLAANPGDKIMPAFSSFVAAMQRVVFRSDPAVGQPLFWFDTWFSLARLGAGVGISALLALTLGVLVGFIPYVRSALDPMIATLSLIPPLAVLPILFIAFGLGETSKVILIVFGIAPVMVRDIVLTVMAIPREQIIKAQTLGASTWQMIIGVVLPQIMPRLIDSVRLSLGAAWLYVIAAEAITAEGGLGYRIFLVRRYLAMDVILPYVAWITILAFVLDFALRQLSQRAFPWKHLKEA
ncbi:ABC transporter permease [Hansschlegelia plantiphila]|uniref:ABC transporter permease n=1 Tax=Hansschlegelia plantiphila TaxID=374655 RepID=A0A9W6MVM1_9HYPH|nr:ABC transporter permease subunit [Hansschlegelia plantiphila]GLK68082.1 ABC transporter permease [Hansschlegelia plantiphila]